jgi:uncharacterized low-complexity protein
MLDMRKITAATAVVGALTLPATAMAASDGSDGYRGLNPKAVDNGTSSLIADAADGYRGIGSNAGEGGSYARTDSADGYRGLGQQADTRVTPVVHVVDVPGEEFHWDDAGIGAAGGVAVIAIAGGIALVATGRRRSPRRLASTS